MIALNLQVFMLVTDLTSLRGAQKEREIERKAERDREKQTEAERERQSLTNMREQRQTEIQRQR